MQCKHEDCSNKRKAFEYLCTPCKRVAMVSRIARELLQEMVGPCIIKYGRTPNDIVGTAWNIAETLVEAKEKERNL